MTVTLRIYFTGKFETIGVCQVCIGGGDGKDDGIRFSDVFENHVANLFLNILWLISDRYLGEPRQIDEGEGEDVGGEDSQINRDRRNSSILSCLCVCFSYDFVSYFSKVVKLLTWEMEKLAPFVWICCIIAFFIDFETICRI